ncbi:UDP-glycosyltransferase 88B1-like [Olea europaea var. sylvestris]|uniref:UDP-glycosyltransferase 88B1-like n=1 Tax=Olea europaea var. sylvestris TaxID=158386 RepID=UPI000C1D02F8|nr:UDP-glycosyltransferase 88B1-like [Olea europaea var. sylvestris]
MKHHFDLFSYHIHILSSMADTIVLYPSPGIGHLISMVELGKLLLKHRPSFSITIFITTAPYTTGVTAPYINHVASTTSSITFHQLSTVELSPTSAAIPFEELLFEIPRLNNPYLHEALQNISQKSNLLAFFIDFFCNAAFEVSSKLGIPTYYFYTSGASALCVFLHIPTLHETITKNIKDVHDYIKIPGTPPIYSQDLPKVLFDRESRIYKLFLETAVQMGKSSGILVNSFEALESRAVKALSDGLSIPNSPTPPVHCIGPLIASKDNGSNNDEHECLSWLNLQPSKSVVFLCFGSMGSFTAEQLQEMAAGLENSGHRFLWVVRNPPTDDETKGNSAPAEPDLDALLPEGFLERTKDKGLVVKSWAPQLEVLNHDSIGGFVTHCGWNSALEAICAGVPMLAWPLYAEQRMNRVFMVEELKVALGLTESTNGFVTAVELNKQVRELMDSDNGKAVKDQVMVMRNCAKAAIQDGGSSRVALEKLIESWAKG